MKRRSLATTITALGLAGAFLLSGCSGNGGTTDGGADEGAGGDLSGRVVMLLPNTTTTRFVEHDGPGFEQAMAEIAPGVSVEIQNAEGDAARQLTQIETAVSQGVDAIVLVTADPKVSAAGLVRADDAGIPVISYEHEAIDGPVAYQIMSDPYRVGLTQGQYLVDNLPESDAPLQVARLYGNAGDNYTDQVKRGQDEIIQPLIDAGDIEIVCEDNAQGWDPANAQQLTEQCLTKTQNGIDVVLASNDGTASGAIAALAGQNLAGEIPVHGGLDANIEALRYIMEGKQEMSAYRNFYEMGDVAAQLVVSLLQGEEESALVNDVFDNNFEEVPAVMVDIYAADADTIGDLVEIGIYTKEDICDGAQSVGYCG